MPVRYTLLSMKIEIRHAEPSDAAAVQAIYASPGSCDGTLQLPCAPMSLWQQRLTEPPAMARVRFPTD